MTLDLRPACSICLKPCSFFHLKLSNKFSDFGSRNPYLKGCKCNCGKILHHDDPFFKCSTCIFGKFLCIQCSVPKHFSALHDSLLSIYNSMHSDVSNFIFSR